MTLARHVTELEVYQAAYAQAMAVFQATKKFPAEERYSLTDQVRRASRSVSANLAEAWGKRRYEAHFLSKLTDADAENYEIATWLRFSLDCGYLPAADHDQMLAENRKIGAMLGVMIKNHNSFCRP